MLLIDEPLSVQSLAQVAPLVPPTAQRLCPAPGTCPMTAASSIGVGNYTGSAAGRENVYQAIKAGENSLAWLGVPVDPPGTSGNRVLRMVNVRADAASVGVSSTLIPSNIIMYITISGTGALPLSNNTLNVAYVAKGMEFSATGGTFNQCEPGSYEYDLNFKELFGTAFRDNQGPVNDQYLPGTIYNTESMWSSLNMTNAAGVAGVAGVASQGTRLIARFSNVPANITLTVPGTNSGGVDTAWRVSSPDANGAGGTLVTTSTNVSLSGGAGMAVWEIVDSTAGNINTVTFTVTVAYGSNPLPGLGTATVTGNYGPTSTLNTMQLLTVPAPRFVNDPQSATTFEITSCQTNLLFPYITNAAGFDTGISIANTSTDPGPWAYPQQGPCTLYYYGLTGAAGDPPPSQTSAIVPSGKSLIFTLSNGGAIQGSTTASVLATPDFTGYMIARCNFQYAHGYAFISDLGIRNWAQGYIALILDHALDARTPYESEVLGN
jgi:hypothetical protein